MCLYYQASKQGFHIQKVLEISGETTSNYRNVHRSLLSTSLVQTSINPGARFAHVLDNGSSETSVGVFSMHEEAVQKEFQLGLSRLAVAHGFLGLCVAVVCICQAEASRESEKRLPAAARTDAVLKYVNSVHDPESIIRGARETDLYLVAAHNLPEGKVLTKADVQVVKMPGLHGYELAFFSPMAVIGQPTARAIPEGQPVLPYHVKKALKKEVDVFEME